VAPVGAPEGAATPSPTALTRFLAAAVGQAALSDQRRLAQAFDEAVTALLKPEDVQAIEGRSFIKRSGWTRLARCFNVDVRIVSHAVQHSADGHIEATVICEAQAPWGQLSQEIGACSSRERRFARDRNVHAIVATASTRARNRCVANLIGAGAVSAEEIDSLPRRTAR
jgi:hypothetical protein